MNKVAREQHFSRVRPLEGGGGGGVGGWAAQVWKFSDKVTTKTFPNITNLIYAILKPL